MNQLDNLLYAKICNYFPLVNCKSSDITNLMSTNSKVREMIKENVNIEKHRLVRFSKRTSKIKWTSDMICLTCDRIKENDFNELVYIRNAFSNVHANRFTNISYRGSSSSIFIHRNTQQELETFLVKLGRVTKNVVISRNYCCEGKGVEIELS